MSDDHPRTAFLGLGTMGGAMALNLAKAGVPLTVWNRSEGKTADLEKAGATVASSAADAVRDAQAVVTMLTGDDVLEDLFSGDGGVAAALPEDSLVLEMSTTSPDFMRALVERLPSSHVVDAPVFGSSEPAASGDLWACVGAGSADLERARGLLDIMCATVFHLGPVGAGSQMKVCGNLVVTGMVSLLGESLTLGRAGGIDPRQMLEVLTAIDFTSPVWEAKGGQMIDEDFTPGFATKHALKDINLALANGDSLGVGLSTVAAVRDRYAAAVDGGHGDDDLSSTVTSVTRTSGTTKGTS